MTSIAPEPHIRRDHRVPGAFGAVGASGARLDRPRIVALGDSVTVGVGDQVLPGGNPGWAAHLATALDASHFANLATLGARARDVRDRQLAVAVTLRPSLATLVIGGNDVLRGDFDATSVGRDVGVVCDALVRIGSQVVIVLLHDPRESLPGPRVIRDVLSRRARSVNCAIIDDVGRTPGVTVVDPRGRLAADDRTLWHIDRMHPGPLGHRALARMVIGELDAVRFPLRQNIPIVPAARPGATRQAAWLIRNGLPWFAKRSRDLLPELARVCWRERHLVDSH